MPKLKVKRDWATGLDPNFVDNYVLTSMFDHRNFNEYNFELRDQGEEGVDKPKVPGKAKVDELSLFATESYPELPKKKGRRLTTDSLTHLTTYSLTHLTTYSFTHLTTYSLTHLTT